MKKRRIIIGGIVIAIVLGITIPWAVGAGPFPASEEDTNEPVAIGPSEQVASGTTGGSSWTLTGYESTSGLCLELFVSGGSNLAGGGCGYGVPAEQSVSLNVTRSSTPALTFVFGPVSKAASKVSIALADGTSLSVTPIKGSGLVNYFVTAFANQVSVVSVTALDVLGKTLGTASA